MCFGGKSEKDNDPAPRPAQQPQRPEHVKDPSSYPYPSSAASSSNQHTYAPPSGPPPSQQQYAAPPGPPPSHHQNEFAPPAGPPPGYKPGYAPPPPNQDWAVPPPPEAPPSQEKAEHNWQAAVPDTSLFPPPPAIFSGHDYSPVNNATEEEAEAGEAWCAQHPLTQPMHIDAAAKKALDASNLRLMEPAGFNGKLNWLALGHWEASTAQKSPDKCIIGYPPLYLVDEHDPTRYGQPKTIYYEVKVRPGSKNNTIAVGFTALPYPSFRLPGWHRGSLAVHGDDGRKYINDRWGGKDFTHEFRKGETLGIGMTFAPNGTSRPEVSVFFTRDGVRAGGWNLHEETDAEQDLPVTGLEGFHDLSCAIGIFDNVDLEVVFDPAKWMYKPT
ncbi:hypothetical protein J3458_009473 [Metarhizium acridum]|uniref:SPRY domain-containing protein n=1 Tax=Metarhizium acridum (strain CQMa 102) TaxID=655827 RepID=E9EI44_METAQ|nr:uncharacterized protein MAC_09542 [Metarhizium acridum CQMa 102]EFY84415.1 hypothetical protein MAC_09542 [Metarhizium acridum CQMa 102]KAG8415645.1 hypothetical protein J3458_009473 [Metarhizium acridum]